MAGNQKDPVLVVVQLSGGNDFMNTVVPYTAGIYYDSRPVIGLKENEVLPIHDTLAWNPNCAPLQSMYEAGNIAVVQGIGYPNSDRSHFRAMDIWHTCEPIEIGTEGWAGRVIRELDPGGHNVLTGVSVGKGLPRAMAVPGVPVTSFDNLDTYGLLTGIDDAQRRTAALEVFKGMYGHEVGAGMGDGLPFADRPQRHLGDCGTEEGENGPQFDRGVWRQRHRRQPARRGPRPSGRAGHARLLHRARRLRQPRQ